jgi:hypothetical protein
MLKVLPDLPPTMTLAEALELTEKDRIEKKSRIHLECVRRYNEKNHDELLRKKKEYRKIHREELSIKNKEYRAKKNLIISQ